MVHHIQLNISCVITIESDKLDGEPIGEEDFNKNKLEGALKTVRQEYEAKLADANQRIAE